MSIQLIVRRSAAALAFASVAAVLPAFAQTHDHSMSGASQAYMDAMAKMDAEMKDMPMSGKPGVDFALMMIPHHQSAIDMAKAYLGSGESDPDMTKLASEIIAAQEKEIEFLKEWLARNR